MSGAESGREWPVNEVYLSDSLRSFIVRECVLCGETHRHGAKDKTVAEGGRSHRTAHCHGTGRGYEIELAEDAEAPDAWLRWVLGDEAAEEVSL